jgi:hypothetical protein
MWVDGSQRDSTPVINPATGEIIAHVPEATADDARAALEAARRAQPIWAALTPRERATCLRRVGELVRKDVERLARIISLEEGKPLREARFEIEGWTAGFFEYFVDFGRAPSVWPSDNSQQLDDRRKKIGKRVDRTCRALRRASPNHRGTVWRPPPAELEAIRASIEPRRGYVRGDRSDFAADDHQSGRSRIHGAAGKKHRLRLGYMELPIKIEFVK